MTRIRRFIARFPDWLSGGQREFREAMYENRVASLDALRRYDAEHGTSLARLAADPERWRS